MPHPKADIDRLYVKRKEGRRGLLQTEAMYKAEIINTAEYLNTKYIEYQFINTVKSQKSNQPNLNSTIKVIAKVAEELNQINENKQGRHSTHNSKIKRFLKEKWESKVMNGQYIRTMDRHFISKEDTFLWLLRADFKGETESEIIPAQDQALQTKYHGTNILHTYVWKQMANSDAVNSLMRQ